jgi:plastocyanin
MTNLLLKFQPCGWCKILKQIVMKTKTLLSILLMVITITGFSKTWTITNSGTKFTPAEITINLGDTINFSIGSSHNSVEVSQSTWDANGNTPLPGFSVPYGGGKVLPAQLGVGTHYYVCTPHASFGMKGTIVVQNFTGSAEIQQETKISVYPNPSTGLFHLSVSSLTESPKYKLEIYNLVGGKVYESAVLNTTTDIDLRNSSKGIYFFKFSDGQNIITKRAIKQ